MLLKKRTQIQSVFDSSYKFDEKKEEEEVNYRLFNRIYTETLI